MTVPTIAAQAATSAARSRKVKATAVLGDGRNPASRKGFARRDNPPRDPKPEPEPESAPEPRGGSFSDGVRQGAAEGRRMAPRGGSAVSDGAGVLLAFLAWVWVALPAIKDGAGGPGRMLRAKLTNKGPEGDDLP